MRITVSHKIVLKIKIILITHLCWLLSIFCLPSLLWLTHSLSFSTLFCALRLILTHCITQTPWLASFWLLLVSATRWKETGEKEKQLVFLLCFLSAEVSWFWQIMAIDLTLLLLSHGPSSRVPALTGPFFLVSFRPKYHNECFLPISTPGCFSIHG